MTSLGFVSFQNHLTRPDGIRHATEQLRKMLNCGWGFVQCRKPDVAAQTHTFEQTNGPLATIEPEWSRHVRVCRGRPEGLLRGESKPPWLEKTGISTRPAHYRPAHSASWRPAVSLHGGLYRRRLRRHVFRGMVPQPHIIDWLHHALWDINIVLTGKSGNRRMVTTNQPRKLELMELEENEIQILYSSRMSFIRRSGLCGSGHADFFQRAGAESVCVG